MLVLTRKNREEVLIRTPNGQEIRIQVTRIEHGKVRLSFNAPEDFKITRAELLPQTTSLQPEQTRVPS